MSRQIRVAFAQPFFCPTLAVFAACFLAWSSTPVVAQVTFDWVTVGNPGNAADERGYGDVSYTYRISKYEVTNAQYAWFLNAVATTDNYGLFNSNMESDPRGGITQSGTNGSFTYAVKANMGNKPVNFVSFFDAMRFVNWLENGQGNGDTEAGVYSIGDGLNETREAGARYFVPTEDEWSKAAYHKNDGVTGNYFDYTASSDIVPTMATANANGDISNPGSNVANYDHGANWNGQDGNVTTVGSATSTSPYGTFDQGGNVWEWNELVVVSRSFRGLRGGSWLSVPDSLHRFAQGGSDPSDERNNAGFRVASIAEPNVVPDSFLVTLGTIVSGGVSELAESDDQYLVIDPEFLTFRYQLEFTVDATSPSDTPSGLEFSYESRTLNFVGTVEQKIELFDYDAGQFETVDTRLTTPTDTVVSVIPGGDPARFVQAGTDAMQARISYQNSLQFWVFSTQNLYLPYRVRADHIFWTITP